MKKALYALLLAVELLAGAGLLLLASGWLGWTFVAVVAAVWAALMAWRIAKLKKATEDHEKRKEKTIMALIMLLPTVATFGGIFWIGYMYF